MKKLIKSGVCGTHKQCINALSTKDRSTVAAEGKKKKKKRENANAARLSAIQTYTKANYATKGKSDESSKFEQIGMDQTSNVEDEETNDDNIPFNKLYNHRHTVITKH